MAEQYRVTPIKRLVSSMLAGMARVGMGNFAVLATVGRKSGRVRKVTVAPIGSEGHDYLVSPYGEVSWVHNVRARPQVTLRRGGEETTVRLVEVTGEMPEVVAAYYRREPFARRFMALPDQPTAADFATLAHLFPVFRIEPIDRSL